MQQQSQPFRPGGLPVVWAMLRLHRFARIAQDPTVKSIPAWHTLATHAAHSAYIDLVELGARDTADTVLGTVRQLGGGRS